MNTFIYRFRLWLLGGLFWDEPSAPWYRGKFDKDSLSDDPHTLPLAKILRTYEPFLFQLWQHVHILAHEYREQEAALNTLKASIEPLQEEQGELEEAIAHFPHVNPNPDNDLPSYNISDKPKSEPWEIFLTFGLSLMLFLGIMNTFGLDPRIIRMRDWPMVLLSAFGAFAINTAEYLSIYRYVFSTRRFEHQYTYEGKIRKYILKPFWKRLNQGDPVLCFFLAFVVIEVCFTAPALINWLPLRQQEQLPPKLIAFAASALTAVVNLLKALADAKLKVQWEQMVEESNREHRATTEAYRQNSEYKEAKRQYWVNEEKLASDHQDLHRKLGRINYLLKGKLEAIADKEKKLADLEAKALHEHQRLELKIRCWMRNNSDKIERFNNIAKDSSIYSDSIKHGNGMTIVTDSRVARSDN